MAQLQVDFFDYFSASYVLNEAKWSTLDDRDANVSYIVGDFTQTRRIKGAEVQRLLQNSSPSARHQDANTRSPVQTKMSMFQNYLKYLREKDPEKWRKFTGKNHFVTTRNILLHLMGRNRKICLKTQYFKGKLYITELDIDNYKRPRFRNHNSIIEDEIMKRMTRKMNQRTDSENPFFVVFDAKLNSHNILYYGLVTVAESPRENEKFSLKNIADLSIKAVENRNSAVRDTSSKYYERKYFQCRLSGITNTIICSWRKVNGRSFDEGVEFKGQKLTLEGAYSTASRLEDKFEEKLNYLEALFDRMAQIVNNEESIYSFEIDPDAKPNAASGIRVDGPDEYILYPDITNLFI